MPSTFTYAYDPADRLDTITDGGNRTVDFQYDGDSRLQIVQLPNNTRRVYSYDIAGRLASVRQEQTSTGNLIVEHTYQYDALDRIEQETGTPEPAPFTVPVALMTYDADDRLDTFNGLQCVSDFDGNLVTGPLGGNVAGFTFDARNRLTGIGNASYTYDSEGRRTAKTENGMATTYIHDPQPPLSRLLSARTGNTSTFYVYTPAGMLLYEDGPAGIRVPHHDYRGSTVALSNATGAVIGRVVYGTYGEVVSRSGDTAPRFLYHGAYGVETDATGLCLMRARYYNPGTRRFLNGDPIGFGGGVNLYGFLRGSAVLSVDPSGLDAIYLLDRDNRAAVRQGHAGVLIGNDSTGWSYYSFGPHIGTNFQRKQYPNLKEAVADKEIARYEDYLRYETDSAADRKARVQAAEFYDESYNPIMENCGDVANNIMAAGTDGEFKDSSWRPVKVFDANSTTADEKGKVSDLAKPKKLKP